MAESSDLQRKYREFLDLMPLTLSLAGLPSSAPGKFFSEDQMESRAISIKHAFRTARTIAKESLQE